MARLVEFGGSRNVGVCRNVAIGLAVAVGVGLVVEVSRKKAVVEGPGLFSESVGRTEAYIEAPGEVDLDLESVEEEGGPGSWKGERVVDSTGSRSGSGLGVAPARTVAREGRLTTGDLGVRSEETRFLSGEGDSPNIILAGGPLSSSLLLELEFRKNGDDSWS